MTPRTRRSVAAGLFAAGLLILAGCSSSSSSSTTTSGASSGGGSSHTLTVGVLTDQTGPGASEFATAVAGVKAGVGVAATEGYHIKYIVADTATSPSGALTGAQKLIEQDHVFAILSISSLMFSASDYVTSQGVPVVGASFDGPEWLSPKSYNMFSVIGNLDYTKVTSTLGLFMKSQGVTNLGSLGYGISPSSSAAARAAIASAEAQGIKGGYVNDNFPFGGTNVAPVALAMKSAGVNGISLNVDPNTGFALVTALNQQGVHLKSALLATGYGGDLINSGAAAMQAAQGNDFLSTFEPIEMHTAATQKLQSAMIKYAGVHTDPTFAQTLGYLSVDGLVQGLKGAGSNPTQSSLIKSLSHITDYQATGLWGGHFSVDWSKRPMGDKQCYWVTKFSGSTFHLISGAVPICGNIIPGKTA